MPDQTYTRRADPELAPEFAKDPAQEGFLEHLNAVLAPHAAEELEEIGEPYPTLHVIGVPRSGTTLLYQVLASALEVGYVNNLIAAFWRAPVYGVRLANALGAGRLESDFSSSYGRTQGMEEPHEFGYFWNDALSYPDLSERGPEHGDEIDWTALRRSVSNMAAAAGAPMAFKPMLLIWHLEKMAEVMPGTRYVWITRPHRETALSLLGMRQRLRGSVERWASLRPRGDFDEQPPWSQVAAQVVLLEDAIARAAERLGPDRVLRISYDEICAGPHEVVERVRAQLGDAGHAPDIRASNLPAAFPRGGSAALEAEYGARVDEALAALDTRRGAT